jgi:hypothetical protein
MMQHSIALGACSNASTLRVTQQLLKRLLPAHWCCERVNMKLLFLLLFEASGCYA